MTLTDAQLAHALAEEAGKRLLEARETLRTMDADTWLAKDVGDAVAQQYLNEALSEHRPNDAILSEEALDDDRRLTAERVDHRSTRRHAGVQRIRTQRLGRTRRAVGTS